jgi:hypothetical protein
MNLICFPHYTCGGLLCDILNNTFSTAGNNGGINSIVHGLGKIGDADTIFTDFDTLEFQNTISALDIPDDQWIGTHCWPGQVDISIFNHVILITTTTFRSKIYRWMRAYYHYYEKSAPWLTAVDMQRIDKERETAKNYLIPFEPGKQSNVINIEFAEIVETSTEFKNLMAGKDLDHHMDRWKSINKFLYATDIWKSNPVIRYYEAESEMLLQKYYVYK